MAVLFATALLRRFAEYLAIYDPQTAMLDPRALPRSRAIPPPRILVMTSSDRSCRHLPQHFAEAIRCEPWC